MEKAFQGFWNIWDKETLRDNLTFMALFIGMYESFTDTVENHVESFLCINASLDKEGKLRYKPSEEYIDEIKRRSVDDKGNHNVLKATMLWLMENGAITQNDYDSFLALKSLRNSFAHEMTEYLWKGLYEEHAKAIGELLNLYRKIEKWWINEIEIPIAGEEVPDGYDADDVTSGMLLTFDTMIDVLYGDKSEEYLQVLRDYQSADKGN